MSLVQLYIPTEVVHDTISELGEMGNFQFKDVRCRLGHANRLEADSAPRPQLNGEVNAFQRAFVGEIRRLDEMERRIRFFASQLSAAQPPVPAVPLSAIPPFTTVGPRAPQAFDELDHALAEHETRLAQMNASWEALGKRQRELEEARCVLRETAGFFAQAEGRQGEMRSSFDDERDGEGTAPLLEHAAEAGMAGGYDAQGFDLEWVVGSVTVAGLS